MEKDVSIDIVKQVVSVGPSLGVIFPKELCEENNIIRGDFVYLKITKIVFVKKR